MRRGAEDVTKLPKWAQNKMRALERNAANAEKELKTVLGEHGETGVSLIGLTNAVHHEQPVPDRTQVKFKTEEGSVSIDLRRSFIYVNSSGRGNLAIMPIASNCFGIYLLPRGN